MSFKVILSFLKKFENISSNEDIIEKEIGFWFNENFGNHKGEAEFRVKNHKIIMAGVGQAVKNEVFIKREDLFNKLQEKFGKKAPEEIRFK